MGIEFLLSRLRNVGAEWIKSVGSGVQVFNRCLIDFIYPPFCLLCDQRLSSTERLVCGSCWSGLPVLQQHLKHFPESMGFHFTHTLSIWEYSDSVQDLVHQLKYYGRSVLGNKMGQALAELLAGYEDFAAADFLIPVPLHRRKLRERGYNQSLILAQAVGRVSGIPILDQVLKRVRYTLPQAQLNSEQRAKNVLNAFSMRRNIHLPDKTVILIDDVLTTGNTLNECARACRSVGVKHVFALTVARA